MGPGSAKRRRANSRTPSREPAALNREYLNASQRRFAASQNSKICTVLSRQCNVSHDRSNRIGKAANSRSAGYSVS